MRLSKHIPTLLIAAVVVVGIGVVAAQVLNKGSDGAMAGIKVPKLSAQASAGKVAFDANCARCHGTNAAGTKQGPPFVNALYNPGHHGDEAFIRAARQGVQQHHWPFGDMPPRPEVTDAQLADIVRYVRELQEANGIFYKLHQM
ncbi:MAG: c-type cytochrome [Polaromonas sp.]